MVKSLTDRAKRAQHSIIQSVYLLHLSHRLCAVTVSTAHTHTLFFRVGNFQSGLMRLWSAGCFIVIIMIYIRIVCRQNREYTASPRYYTCCSSRRYEWWRIVRWNAKRCCTAASLYFDIIGGRWLGKIPVTVYFFDCFRWQIGAWCSWRFRDSKLILFQLASLSYFWEKKLSTALSVSDEAYNSDQNWMHSLELEVVFEGDGGEIRNLELRGFYREVPQKISGRLILKTSNFRAGLVSWRQMTEICSIYDNKLEWTIHCSDFNGPLLTLGDWRDRN